MAKRDYIVEVDDATIPEEIHTRKRDAIKAAVEMARKTNMTAIVIPCVDGYADDYSPHYLATPDGKVHEVK